MNYIHKPVLVDEVLAYFPCGSFLNILDATTGEGGYAEVLFQYIDAGKLVCMDRDGEILKKAKERLDALQLVSLKKLVKMYFIKGNFSDLSLMLSQVDIKQFDFALYDLGVSMYHYKVSNRGFAFYDELDLDMRLDKTTGVSAKDIVNHFSFKDIANILFYFGEERRARKIAEVIVEKRKKNPIKSAYELQELVKKIFPKKPGRAHAATKTFQALRIAVNRELDHLIKGLITGIWHLKVGGRLAIISYHSLEDRLVKHWFKLLSLRCICGEDDELCRCGGELVKNLTPRPIKPTINEIKNNVSARSAKLRMVDKIAHPKAMAWVQIQKAFQKKISCYPNYTACRIDN